MSSRHEYQEEITTTLDALTLAVAELQAKTKAQEMLINSLLLALRRSNPDLPSITLAFFNEFKELGLTDLLNVGAELEVEYFNTEVNKIQNSIGSI